jgi:hypothetical protein
MQTMVEKMPVVDPSLLTINVNGERLSILKINQGDATLKTQLILANLQVERFRTSIISFPL